MEYRGETSSKIQGTIHYGGSAPNNIHHGSGEKDFGVDFSANWHTFGLEWDKKEIRWLLDDKLYHTESIDKNMWSHKGSHNPYDHNGAPFDKPFHWILNVAVSGNFFPTTVYGPHVTPEEAKHWEKPTMEIDFVRVYQNK